MNNNLLKIGFLCSADFGLGLLKFIREKSLAEVCCVWSNPDKKKGRSQKFQPNEIVNYSRSEDIPCYQPKNFKQEKIKQIENVKKHHLDLLFVVAYGHILPSDFFLATKHGSVNVHFSLLPKYRGASPIQSSILAGDKSTGITIQKIIQKLDAGNIVLQEKFSIENQNAVEVFQKSLAVAKTVTQKFFGNPISLLENSTVQTESKATFCYKIQKKDGFISAKDNVEAVRNKFLAYYLWPKVFFKIEEVSYQIEEIDLNFNQDELKKILPENLQSQSLLLGHLYFIQKKIILILDDGAIHIIKIKKSGKKAMTGLDFVNGCKFDFPIKIDDEL